MVNFGGYSPTVPFTPVCSNIIKNHCRLPINIYRRNLTKSRSVSSYTQAEQLHYKAPMVARNYLPPWFSVAPMMDWTDNHYRTLARLISKHAWLYTEMLAAETIVYQKDNLDRFLEYSPEQHPIVLQIGGNNLENLAKATELANPYFYDEMNFNCGCPSPKVAGHGCFGVRLMLDPKFVGEAMSVIAANTNVPVSVKCRIGVDDHDSYNELCDFIYKVSSLSPTKHFIIHSRKALLNGISPADNRTIPPLKYEYFYGLLRDFPDLRFTINGGITDINEVNAARSAGAHGVMVGRAAYHNPWHTLGNVDTAIYGAPSCGLTRRQIIEKYQVYGDSVLGKYGSKPHMRDIVKPLLHFFYSEPGNGLWKRKADAAFQHCTTLKSFFEETLVAIPDSVMDSSIPRPPSGREDLFSNMESLLPPSYEASEDVVLCA
ncbi:tRNA-dihydrouridine synthase [Quillaja saponaria]|uniref:tRNA-dihydrouridine synthase n=1 Tax=Quillaja saponaria TaxID=32244 RepID=A0AAD7PBV8_QUISA|nr:tRNA-dihydrouridine synthase [Quillaja saponaria]